MLNNPRIRRFFQFTDERLKRRRGRKVEVVYSTKSLHDGRCEQSHSRSAQLSILCIAIACSNDAQDTYKRGLPGTFPLSSTQSPPWSTTLAYSLPALPSSSLSQRPTGEYSNVRIDFSQLTSYIPFVTGFAVSRKTAPRSSSWRT